MVTQGTTQVSPATNDPTRKLWGSALQECIDNLPDKDRTWLVKQANEDAVRAGDIVELVEACSSDYGRHFSQRVLNCLAPVCEHIDSFARVIGVYVQSNPGIVALVWGSIFLVTQVALRTQKHVERLISIFEEITPDLDLFRRWLRLFPQREYAEVAAAIEQSYVHVIELCVDAVKFFSMSPMRNASRTLFQPSVEQTFQQKQSAIKYHTERVRTEVLTAHMASIPSSFAKLQASIKQLSGAPSVQLLPASAHKIPYGRNNRFFGRADILSAISMVLGPSTAGTWRKSFALFGLGGSGKTQIALEYAYRSLDIYRSVIWFSADSKEKIVQGFRDFARQIGRDPESSMAVVRANVFQWLDSLDSNYLMIFDNADDVAIIYPWLPTIRPGKILLTSRDAVAATELSPKGAEVTELSLEAGCAFLRASLTSTYMGASVSELEPVYNIFAGFPLGLAQAAAFIRTRKCSVEDFLTIYQERSLTGRGISEPLEGYNRTLANVWDMSFTLLDGNALMLLLVLVHFDPDLVPFELLLGFSNTAFAGEPTSATERDVFYDALRSLRSQSVLQVNEEDQSITIHRFLRECVFRRLSSSLKAFCGSFERAVDLIHRRIKWTDYKLNRDPSKWAVLKVYLPHIRSLYASFNRNPTLLSSRRLEVSDLLYHAAQFLDERSSYRPSFDTSTMAIQLLTQAKVVDHSRLLRLRQVQSRQFNHMNQPAQTEITAIQAMDSLHLLIWRGLLTEADTLQLARLLTNWGNALNQFRRFQESMAIHDQAVKATAYSSPEDAPIKAMVHLNRGSCLLRMNKSEEAETEYRRVLEQVLPGSPETCLMYGNLCVLQGRMEEALDLYTIAWRVWHDSLGSTHDRTCLLAYKMGDVLYRTERLLEAATLLQSSLDNIAVIAQQNDSIDHKVLHARGSRKLGQALAELGRPAEARVHLEKAWDLLGELTGQRGGPDDTDEDYSSLLFFFRQ